MGLHKIVFSLGHLELLRAERWLRVGFCRVACNRGGGGYLGAFHPSMRHQKVKVEYEHFCL